VARRLRATQRHDARRARGEGSALNTKQLGVGMIGYGFMGRAHSNAYAQIRRTFGRLVPDVELISLAGRSEAAVAAAAERYGFRKHETDWRRTIADPDVSLVNVCAWHDVHAVASIDAATRGKHVVCEKPMALTVDEARTMRDAAVAAGIVHRVAFNYRFAPAVVMARRLIADGRLGRIHRVRISYLIGGLASPTTPWFWDDRVSGVLLNLGSHVIDMARYLVGEPVSVTGLMSQAYAERPMRGDPDTLGPIEADDSVVAAVEFENGALGCLEASWLCSGRNNQFSFEVNGSDGSVVWDLDDFNWLGVHRSGQRGFEKILTTNPDDPFMQGWWPPGHQLGWEHLHANLIHEFLLAVSGNPLTDTNGATFEDGYRVAVITEAIAESSRTDRSVRISYE
jgi:predicted dehydrogenase